MLKLMTLLKHTPLAVRRVCRDVPHLFLQGVSLSSELLYVTLGDVELVCVLPQRLSCPLLPQYLLLPLGGALTNLLLLFTNTLLKLCQLLPELLCG